MSDVLYNVYFREDDGDATDILTTFDKKEADRVAEFLNTISGTDYQPVWVSEWKLPKLYYSNFQYMHAFKIRLYHDTNGMSWEILKPENSDYRMFAHCLMYGPHILKDLWMLDEHPEFNKHEYIGYVFANNSEAAAFILLRWVEYFERTGKFGSYDDYEMIKGEET